MPRGSTDAPRSAIAQRAWTFESLDLHFPYLPRLNLRSNVNSCTALEQGPTTGSHHLMKAVPAGILSICPPPFYTSGFTTRSRSDRIGMTSGPGRFDLIQEQKN